MGINREQELRILKMSFKIIYLSNKAWNFPKNKNKKYIF